MNYNEFNEETKNYINMAIDLYSTIKDKDIFQNSNNNTEEKYRFTKLDKKVLSLFIAGFIVDGTLKNILEEYDDIKLNDLLAFGNINIKEVKKLSTEEYASIYQKSFQLDLIAIMKNRMPFYIINLITPMVIVNFMSSLTINGSDILNRFYRELAKTNHYFQDHPIFNAIQNYNLLNGSIREEGRQKDDSFEDTSFTGESRFLIKNKSEKKNDVSLDLKSENIWKILDDVQKKFVGQELAAEGLFYNIINNQRIVQLQQSGQIEQNIDGQRSIIFLDGPTGTGKTGIVREITRRLGIPFVSTPITSYSSAGYKGGDISDILKELYKKANGDIEKAQRGIIVLEEFDKIAYSRSGDLEMKRAVQQQLLDFIGGGKYTINTEIVNFNMDEIEFDTSKVTFVCLAALTDLRTQKSMENTDYNITPKDLIDVGLEKELVFRFNTYLHTNAYSLEALTKILRESTISPLVSFKSWVEANSKKLEIDEDVYDLIAKLSYELDGGARGLQIIINNIRTPFIKEVLRGESEIIHLDSETISKISEESTKRKRLI